MATMVQAPLFDQQEKADRRAVKAFFESRIAFFESRMAFFESHMLFRAPVAL